MVDGKFMAVSSSWMSQWFDFKYWKTYFRSRKKEQEKS